MKKSLFPLVLLDFGIFVLRGVEVGALRADAQLDAAGASATDHAGPEFLDAVAVVVG